MVTKRIVIPYFDMDETIVQFAKKLDENYMARYGKERPDDPTKWNLCRESCDIFREDGFFYSLEPYPNSLEVMKKLFDEGFDVRIITNPCGRGQSAKEKYEWIADYLPWLPTDNIFMMGNKGAVATKTSILVDDAPKYLANWEGFTCCMDFPYNQEFLPNYRIFNHDFNEVYSVIHQLEKELSLTGIK